MDGRYFVFFFFVRLMGVILYFFLLMVSSEDEEFEGDVQFGKYSDTKNVSDGSGQGRNQALEQVFFFLVF